MQSFHFQVPSTSQWSSFQAPERKIIWIFSLPCAVRYAGIIFRPCMLEGCLHDSQILSFFNESLLTQKPDLSKLISASYSKSLLWKSKNKWRNKNPSLHSFSSLNRCCSDSHSSQGSMDVSNGLRHVIHLQGNYKKKSVHFLALLLCSILTGIRWPAFCKVFWRKNT